MTIRRILAGLAASLLATFMLPSSASAASCMVKQLQPVAQVPEAARGQPYYVIVDDTDAAALRARGLADDNCEAAFKDEAEQALYRDRICALANFGNEAVQNQLTRALGVRPRELCDTAQRALGPASEIAETDPLALLQPQDRVSAEEPPSEP